MSDLMVRLRMMQGHSDTRVGDLFRQAADALEAATHEVELERESHIACAEHREAAEATVKGWQDTFGVLTAAEAEEQYKAADKDAADWHTQWRAAEARAEKAERALAMWQGLAENGTVVVATSADPDSVVSREDK